MQCNLFRINGPLLSKGAGGGRRPPNQLSPREQHVPRARINGLRRISRTPLHSTQHLLILAKLETSDDKSFRRMALSMGLGGRAGLGPLFVFLSGYNGFELHRDKMPWALSARFALLLEYFQIKYDHSIDFPSDISSEMPNSSARS